MFRIFKAEQGLKRIFKNFKLKILIQLFTNIFFQLQLWFIYLFLFSNLMDSN